MGNTPTIYVKNHSTQVLGGFEVYNCDDTTKWAPAGHATVGDNYFIPFGYTSSETCACDTSEGDNYCKVEICEKAHNTGDSDTCLDANDDGGGYFYEFERVEDGTLHSRV